MSLAGYPLLGCVKAAHVVVPYPISQENCAVAYEHAGTVHKRHCILTPEDEKSHTEGTCQYGFIF